jgi:hypothetical protein
MRNPFPMRRENWKNFQKSQRLARNLWSVVAGIPPLEKPRKSPGFGHFSR